MTLRFLILAWLLGSSLAFADDDTLIVATDNDQEITVHVYPNEADTPLLIWLEELDDARPAFESLMLDLQANGFTVWRTNLLDAFFLERSPTNVRGLDGRGVLALLRKAETTGQPYMLVSADRMSIPSLRGARRWQAEMPAGHHFLGAALVYPNLFEPAPPAGIEPELMSITRHSSAPIYLLQPEYGALRSRMTTLLDALGTGGAPTFSRIVPKVRDWYFMHERGENPDEDAATAQMPRHLLEATKLLGKIAPRMPRGMAAEFPDPTPTTHVRRGLIAFPDTPAAPGYRLSATLGGEQSFDDVRGKVALVNFWATWCPPCVHEIPSMNRLAQQFRTDQFRIVSINFKEDPAHIREFMNKVQVDFPVLIDPQGHTADAWRVFAFPSSFLIDRAGRIRYSVNSAIEWDTTEAITPIQGLIAEDTSLPAH
ncbi:MAG: TlpA family protein disulfide reductase [Gammaproteobacteria bacterium]|nr:TlpA family protein disulfide reductase [Gammaproteobacteria bacterium]MCP5135654.1 TlpA family protein disulfide reductase [Gammaproteobacteria bacterium]